MRARAGRELVQALAERDIGLVTGDLEAGVSDFLELRTHGCEHARVAMARVQHRDAAGEVNVPVSVRVPQQRILGALDENRLRHRDAARNGRIAPRDQGFVVFHVDLQAVRHFTVR